MNRDRGSVLAGLLIALLVPVLVFAAVGTALRMPASAALRPLGDPAPLDYSRGLPQAYSPLRASFIEQVLGGVITGPGGTFNPLGTHSNDDLPAEGRVVVSHPLTNDDFGSAYQVPSIPFTAKTNSAAATREQGEPASCEVLGGTVWYRYTASSDLGLIANTFGTSYGVALAAFAGNDLGSLRQVGCDEDGGRNSQIAFAAKAGTTYYFQITGPFGGGDLVFNLQPWGRTSRVSVSSSGEEARDHSYRPSVSADGRYVVFHSAAPNLVPDYRPCINHQGMAGSQYACTHIYVRDRIRGTTEMVSVSSSGEQGDGQSFNASISDDGRFVAFISWASNLVDGDTNAVDDVFVHDRVSKTTTRVSVSSTGRQAVTFPDFKWNDKIGYRMSSLVYISGDGRYVVFDSVAPNLVAGDTNRTWDVFVRDTHRHTTTRVSVSSSGRQGNDESVAQGISADGRVVLFVSDANNLVPGRPRHRTCDEYESGCYDLYAHDRRTGETSVVNVSSSGEWDDEGTQYGAVGGTRTISDDYRFVVFVSWGPNLVAGDTNGGPDVFVRDRLRGTTRRVSLSSSGEQQEFERPTQECYPIYGCTGGAFALGRALSADGRYVSFVSNAYNLAPGAPRQSFNAYVRDTLTGTTTLVSVSSGGVAGAGAFVALSADGRQVFFQSASSDLVEGDTNLVTDVFVHERFRR